MIDLHASESERLATLREMDVLDSAPEKEFDDLVRLASVICATPMSLITLVDEKRQWFKAAFGTEAKETHRDVSFCAYAIQQPSIFIVEDASLDERFSRNPFVIDDPNIRFYAGVPLCAANGHALGTLCVVDVVPRRLSGQQVEALTILASQVQARMNLRLKERELSKALHENQSLCSNLQATNDLFLAFMNHGQFASYIKDADGMMVFYNKYMANHFGVTESEWLGRKDHEIWPREIADTFRRNDVEVLSTGIPVEVPETSPGPDAGPTHWKSLKFPYTTTDGRRMLAGMSVDVTQDVVQAEALQRALREKNRLTRELQASQHVFQAFMEHNPNHAFVKDERGRYVFYNRAFADFFGIGEDDWKGRSVHEVLPVEGADKFHAQDMRVLHHGEVVEEVDRIADLDGTMHSFSSIKFTYRDVNGKRMLAGIARDISEELKRNEALADANRKLNLLAMTDPLTGLSNRRVFEARADREFTSAKRQKQPLSVILLDVDNFKRLNDEFGHAVGDEALRMIGVVLKGCLRTRDLAARVGGEEFALLLPETEAQEAKAIARRVQDILGRQKTGPTTLTVSVGVSCVSEKVTNWKQLLSKADEAMYVAKRTGKNRVVNHDSHLREAVKVEGG